MPRDLKVGQLWRNRSGDMVRITADRFVPEHGDPPPVWRWALHNGHIADREGRLDFYGHAHPGDLILLIEDVEKGGEGMDSIMGAPI